MEAGKLRCVSGESFERTERERETRRREEKDGKEDDGNGKANTIAR